MSVVEFISSSPLAIVAFALLTVSMILSILGGLIDIAAYVALVTGIALLSLWVLNFFVPLVAVPATVL